MATTDKISFNTITAPAVTSWDVLASAGSACCAAVDNSTTLYDDIVFTVKINSNTTPAADKTAYVYAYGSFDGTNYNISSNEMASPGTDATLTLDSPTNLAGPMPVYMPTASKSYFKNISMAAMFGGLCPKKCGLIVNNVTNQAFVTGSGIIAAVGIYYTNA